MSLAQLSPSMTWNRETGRTVLVTDGNERSALAIVRSLGRAGHVVHVAASRRRSLAAASRFAASETVVGTTEGADHYATTVARTAEELGANILIPVTEASLRAVLPRRSEFSFLIPFPDDSTFRTASDKSVVLDIARGLGIPTPEGLVVSDRASLPGRGELRFPVVLKPSRSVVTEENRQTKLSVVYASTPVELQTAVESLPASAFPLLVQERVVGPGIGVFLLRWNGETVMTFAHRRIREKPPSGGVSTYREAIPIEPQWLEHAEALLSSLDWQGVAMIEFKLDGHRPVLMECNGRFWGSLQLAIDAGADFPSALVACATGQDCPDFGRRYGYGVRTRWFWGDVDHLMLRLVKPAAELNLPPDAPGRFKTLLSFLYPWRPGDRFEVARLSDPRPFARETLSRICRR